MLGGSVWVCRWWHWHSSAHATTPTHPPTHPPTHAPKGMACWAFNGLGLALLIPNAQSLIADYFSGVVGCCACVCVCLGGGESARQG